MNELRVLNRVCCADERIAALEAENKRLREALERIRKRAFRVRIGELKGTGYSVASYDYEVAHEALEREGGSTS